jgi:hypothetical protein
MGDLVLHAPASRRDQNKIREDRLEAFNVRLGSLDGELRLLVPGLSHSQLSVRRLAFGDTLIEHLSKGMQSPSRQA